MKILKYLTMIALCAGFTLTSCDQKDIDFGLQYVDPNSALYQVFYVNPVANTTANYVYRVDVGDKSYFNNGSSMITRYSGIPSGSVNLWYNDATGTKDVRFYTGSMDNLAYSNSATLTQGLQSIWVYNFDKAPIVLKETEAPQNLGTDNDTIAGCSMKFYNFLFKDATTPVDFKVQFYIRDYHDWFPAQQNEDGYVAIGEPIAFGESTDWEVWNIKKSIWNSYGYNANYYLAVKNVETGEYISYINSAGSNLELFAITQTLSFGRAYLKYLYGTLEDVDLNPTVGTFTRY
ncbi:MAG: hypothetical protein LIP03_01565 [Bacteroidales bacterium]|nr:hypothetical protein [Bacteroidales bacterium]